MKIQVWTSEYEYMGLPLGLVTEADSQMEAGTTFVYNGKVWHLEPYEYKVMENPTEQVDILKTPLGKPIKSDGGSSAYYDFKVPQHYLDLIAVTGIIKTEYLIDIIFKNDFDFACSFKALVRAKGITEGAGKDGNTLDYELNKTVYYTGKIKEKDGWRNE